MVWECRTERGCRYVSPWLESNYIAKIDAPINGTGVTITYTNGTTETIDYGNNQADFIKAGVNFRIERYI